MGLHGSGGGCPGKLQAPSSRRLRRQIGALGPHLLATGLWGPRLSAFSAPGSLAQPPSPRGCVFPPPQSLEWSSRGRRVVRAKLGLVSPPPSPGSLSKSSWCPPLRLALSPPPSLFFLLCLSRLPLLSQVLCLFYPSPIPLWMLPVFLCLSVYPVPLPSSTLSFRHQICHFSGLPKAQGLRGADTPAWMSHRSFLLCSGTAVSPGDPKFTASPFHLQCHYLLNGFSEF